MAVDIFLKLSNNIKGESQDSTHRNVESARFCTRYSGLYRYRVRVFSGAGAVGVQVLIDP